LTIAEQSIFEAVWRSDIFDAQFPL